MYEALSYLWVTTFVYGWVRMRILMTCRTHTHEEFKGAYTSSLRAHTLVAYGRIH